MFNIIIIITRIIDLDLPYSTGKEDTFFFNLHTKIALFHYNVFAKINLSNNMVVIFSFDEEMQAKTL
jgi:hypothetical protein